MHEELNENLELENKEVLNNENSGIYVEGGKEVPTEDLNQTVLDLQSEIMEKDSLIEELKQQILAFDEIQSTKLFVAPEPKKVTPDELKNEKLPGLLEKLQEFIYYAGKTSLNAAPGGTVQSVNETKKAELKAEINSLLKELGNLELK